VSDFQNLLKKYCSLHQKFAHKKSRLYQPSRNNNAENPNNDHWHSRNSHSIRFIVPNANATNSVLYVDKARYTTVQMEKWPQQPAWLYLWRQNTHFCFSDWKCTTCDVIFIDWVTKWQVFLFGSGCAVGLLAVAWLEKYAEVCIISSTVMIVM